MEAAFSSESHLTFNGLHGVISQEIELFISTAVRTSDPTVTNVAALNGKMHTRQ
jgi:hypothetical protein